MARRGGISIEDNMRETLHVLNILSTEERVRFMQLFASFVRKRQRPSVKWSDVALPPEGTVLESASIPPCPSDESLRHALLDKLVVLKLNGGLGSRLGCSLFPKSAIEVRQELSFLDLTVKQIEFLNTQYGADVPLVLLNSFKTHDVTSKLIRKYRSHNLTIHTILQSTFPRIVKDTLMPMPSGPFSSGSPSEWYPPGHGDVYYALYTSGLLESLIKQGKEMVFISNIDNLGGTVDLNLLYHLVTNDVQMCMCVTSPSKADTDGGYLVGHQDRPFLAESVSFPAEERLQRRETTRYFNTNNLWVSLATVHQLVATGAELWEDVVVQERVVEGVRVLQLETLAGSVVRHLDPARVLAVNVPRERYLSVRTISDLFLVQSNLFEVSHGSLRISPMRQPPTLPLVKLGHEFDTIESFLRRVPYGVPDVLELDHLTLCGDVCFGRNVRLKGTVIIVADEGSTIFIPDGSVLEDKVITGHLRVLDH